MERNITLDYFKFALSILVILIHVPLFKHGVKYEISPQNIFSWLLSNGIARIAVPCFFLINGYYINVVSSKNFKKYIFRLFLIYIVWFSFYLPILAAEDLNKEYIEILLIYFIRGYYHLWYLSALIGASILLYVFNSFFKKKCTLLFIISILLFLIGYIIQYQHSNNIHYSFYRNFLFFGFPFLSIGYIIKDIEILKYKNTAVYIGILGICTLLSESFLSLKYQLGTDLYFSLLLVCPCALVVVLNYSKNQISDGYFSKIASYIFFSHIFVQYIICRVFEVSNIFLFPCILIISILLGSLLIETNKRIKIFL